MKLITKAEINLANAPATPPLRCDECQHDVLVTVMLGGDASDEQSPGLTVCADCMGKALMLFSSEGDSLTRRP